MGRAVRDGRRADALRCGAPSLSAPPEQDPMDGARRKEERRSFELVREMLKSHRHRADINVANKQRWAPLILKGMRYGA